MKTPLKPEDDLTVEIPARLTALCGLYKIDGSDPLWERKLLLMLSHRHVPGFGFKPGRSETVDNVFIIETIDSLKDYHESRSGVRPSTDAVVTEMMSLKGEHPWMAGLTHSRLMRIYSGRREENEHQDRAMARSVEKLRQVFLASKSVQKAPAGSHAPLFKEMLGKRAQDRSKVS